MKSPLERIMRFRFASAAFALSGLLLIGGWLWAIFVFAGRSQAVVVQWNSIQGIISIGDISHIAFMAISGLVMVGVNFALALILEERDWFWGKFVAAATLSISILIFIGFAAIISVN